MGDFHETGALCKAIETMVSVDTSVVHPAGAIGQKVYLLLPYNANVRWHEKHSDSPITHQSRYTVQTKTVVGQNLLQK